MKKWIWIGVLSVWPMLPGWGLTFPMPFHGNNVVGNVDFVTLKSGESLRSLGRLYDIGFEEMRSANPRFLQRNPSPGDEIIIPGAFILPDAPRRGIVINLPEMRLYYYHPDGEAVSTFPIGVGRAGWKTPLGLTRVVSKEADPEWRPPESIKAYMLEKGVSLPDVMPAGPKNPLGKHAIRLGLPGYLIHGTNRPASIGKRSSSGCIRMYPEDVAQLFEWVGPGTSVTIINQPYKVGWLRNELYIEAHLPFWDQLPNQGPPNYLVEMAVKNGLWYRNIRAGVPWDRVYRYANQHEGLPRFIGRY